MIRLVYIAMLICKCVFTLAHYIVYMIKNFGKLQLVPKHIWRRKHWLIEYLAINIYTKEIKVKGWPIKLY